MTSTHSAAPQALGYIYQIEIALYLLLKEDGGETLSIEHIDDVSFHDEKGDPSERLQIKHHKNIGSLTDFSSDLWKTIKVWCDEADFDKLHNNELTLTILTTANAKDGSIASLLRPERRRDTKDIIQRLEDVASASTNAKLKTCFTAFLELSNKDKYALTNSIVVLDNSPLIQDVGKKIKKLLWGIRPLQKEAALERIRGWWYGKIYNHLLEEAQTSFNESLITKDEINLNVAYIAEQFGPDVLPMDFRRTNPEIPDEADSRVFVKQLELIGMSPKIIEQAILDYYRAFWQRSYWIRDSLLDSFGELDDYENRLIEEWNIFSEQFKMKLGEGTTEDDLRECGKSIYFGVLREHIPIRSGITESYFMRGSYQMLADSRGDNLPRVGWHPEFISHLEKIFLA